MQPPHGSSRRSFLLTGSGWLTSAWIAAQWPAIAAAAHHATAAPVWTGYQFLTSDEARDVDAITAQIVPSGETPGAREAHAVCFVDRALITFFAAGAAEFRAGVGEFQVKFRADQPAFASFCDAPAAAQIRFLETVDQTPFFEMVRMLTLLGMFSSPKYGGNDQGLGWRLMGFEDRHAFTPPFGYYDARYSGFVPYANKPAADKPA